MGSADRSTRKDKQHKDAKKDALEARLAELKELHDATQRHKSNKK